MENLIMENGKFFQDGVVLEIHKRLLIVED